MVLLNIQGLASKDSHIDKEINPSIVSLYPMSVERETKILSTV